MNLVADESIDRPIVERLRLEGHHVSYVAEIEPGISDEAILEIAVQEDALLDGYLYPASLFAPITLPKAAERAISSTIETTR